MTEPATVTITTPEGTTKPVTLAQFREAAEAVKSGAGMKADPEFDAAKDKAYRVIAEELRQFIERIERLEAEKKDIADRIKEVKAEARGRGYDVRVMTKLISIRKRDKDDIAEEEAVLAMYKEALGM